MNTFTDDDAITYTIIFGGLMIGIGMILYMTDTYKNFDLFYKIAIISWATTLMLCILRFVERNKKN